MESLKEAVEEYIDQQRNRPKTGQVFFKVDVKIMQQSKVLKILSATDLQTLIALMSHADENLTCYPTQKRIASLLGVSERSINKRIKALASPNKVFQGKQILEKQLVLFEGEKDARNLYRINPDMGFEIFSGRTPERQKHPRRKYRIQKIRTNNTHISNQNYKNNQNKLKCNAGNFKIEKNFDEKTNIKIKNVVDLLVKTDKKLEGNHQKAAGRVISHINKIGLDKWREIYSLHNRLGIHFYNFITYHMLVEKMSYVEALSEWDRTR